MLSTFRSERLPNFNPKKSFEGNTDDLLETVAVKPLFDSWIIDTLDTHQSMFGNDYHRSSIDQILKNKTEAL